MCPQLVAIVLLLLCHSSQPALLVGYSVKSCDDLKPQRVPFVQDLMGQPGVIQSGLGANGLPINVPGFNRPNPTGTANMDGINVQLAPVTTVTPYRIVISDSRYKKGRALEGLFSNWAKPYSLSGSETKH